VQDLPASSLSHWAICAYAVSSASPVLKRRPADGPPSFLRGIAVTKSVGPYVLTAPIKN
jgi:hypothetical protein